MSLACVFSRARVGLESPLVTVEVHLANGLPAFNIVGLPETTVREAKDRVRSAIINCGYEFPAKRITINLAPADLPKEGGRFDLPIAVGILAASEQIPHQELLNYEFAGELALSGAVRSIQGVLPFAHACTQANRTAILPNKNASEASLIKQAKILPVTQLLEVYHHITGQKTLEFYQTKTLKKAACYENDLQDVVGQMAGKRAIEIAAAGGHNILFTGPPGTGKTMLASRLITILPDMTDEEALDSAAIHSIVGKHVDPSTWKHRAFRHPHHTSSAVALVGGGSIPRPGEISLAHNGVLFLDEFDAIAKARDDKNEIGELKRVVVSLLQNIDNLGDTILVAATNHAHLLDPAIGRRFHYKMTNKMVWLQPCCFASSALAELPTVPIIVAPFAFSH